jgi:putative thioredoxin
VQSIPMVVAIVGGQVADGFLGAMPEPQVRQWLGQVMQVAERLGMRPGTGAGVAAGDQGDSQAAGQPGDAQAFGERGSDIYAEAQQAMERGDLNAAEAAFEKALAADPGDPVATMGLGQVALIRRVEGYDQAAARRDAASQPDDVDAQARVADIEMAMGRIEESFDRMLATIKRTSGEDRDKARKHLVSLFEIFPPRDPRVSKARTRLSSLLF